MAYILKGKILTGLVLSAVFLGGFMTCMSTPFVDKMSLVSAWEQKSTIYLTSAKAKMLTDATAAAVDSCTLLLPDGHDSGILRSRQAYQFCLSQQYGRYASRFQTISAAYQYASCREGLNTEQDCMEVARKSLPEKHQDTLPIPLPFE
ncbi:hypothetical protein UXO11_22640 [Enterobacter wuhouensis]|uniref:hypothetical protein n=1 Tax=Enterobacter wuhouensis TaxID=2529381 RepID=UPI002FD1EEB0